jgi:hypothetical protein
MYLYFALLRGFITIYNLIESAWRRLPVYFTLNITTGGDT